MRRIWEEMLATGLIALLLGVVTFVFALGLVLGLLIPG